MIVAGVFRSEAVPENERLELPALAAEIQQNGRPARLLADADAIVAKPLPPNFAGGDVVVAILSNGGLWRHFMKNFLRACVNWRRNDEPFIERC